MMNNKFLKLLKQMFDVLLLPCTKNLWLMAILVVFLGGADVHGFLMRRYYPDAVLLHCISVMLSYVLTLLYSVVNIRNVRRTLAWTLSIVSGLIFFVSEYCVFKMHSPFNADFVAAILGTNASEASEFFEAYADWKSLLYVVLIMLSVFVVAAFLRKTAVKRGVAIPMLGYVIVCNLLALNNPQVYHESVLDYINYFNIDTPPSLKDYEQDIFIEVAKDKQPHTIVLILGESHRRTNNFLYGYEKNTNPRLDNIEKSGNLIVFPNVASPACQTIEAFQCLMSTYRPDYGDSVKWYTCTTLPYIMRKAGYQTFWLSNQSKRGLYDNVVGSYAELCDSCCFTGNSYSGMRRNNLDGELLPIVRSMSNAEGNKFIIIHLMGCHEQFSKRFPASFTHFMPSDYTEYTESQRQTRADYDNSVLYTDYIVSEIFKMFSNQDCIGIYLSDHGLDLYDTRDDYAAHGVKDLPASFEAATKIPFFIYMTDCYKERHPDMVDRIESAKDQPFRTDSLIYRLMDIASCRFADASK